MKTNYFKLLKSSLMVLFLCMGLSSWGQTTEILNNNLRTQDNIDLWNPISVDFESGGGGYARFTDLNSSLTTPEFNASAYNSIEVQMSVAKYGGGNDGPITVLYSLDGGVSWNVGGDSSTPSSSTYIGNTLAIDETSSTMVIRFTRTNSPSEKRFRDVIISGIGTGISCQDSNLVFPTATETADLVDGTFTQTATSLNATTAITYTSSDEDVATVNPTTGEVTLVSVGTTTITATQEAGEHSGVDYCAGTATYELTVITTVPVLTVSTDNVSFTGFAGGAVATEDITVEGFNLTGDITLALSGDANFSINPASLSSTGGEVTITYTPSATPATHSATLTVSNGALSEVITLSGVTNEMPEEYAGVGTFEKITSTDDLTDGYYVITNETDAFAMNNTLNTSTSNDYFEPTGISPESGVIINPSTNIVWRIETSGSGKTIYNEVTEKYVGWQSGNSASAENAPANSNRWTFEYSVTGSLDRWTVKNVATTARQLSYNSGAPRFAAYGNNGQQELQLYKLTPPSTDPALSVSESEITGLNYAFGSSVSTPQSFVVSGENLDGTDVTISVDSFFEVSTSETTGFTNAITLAAYDGTDATIWVRLATGQAIGDYNGTVAISGGDAATVNVAVSGSVLAVPVVTDAIFEGTVGVAFNEQIEATENPTLYTITFNSLLAGLSLDSETGIISGTPTEAGVVELLVTATNAAGTSEVGGIVIEIAKGTQTLDGFADLTKYDTDAPFDLTETTNAGLAVSYASSNEAVATITGNTVTIAGLGTTTITATQAGDVNWNEFEQTITLTVTEEPEAPWEDFETGTKGSYDLGTVTATAGEWYMVDAMLGNDANEKRNGVRAARIRNSGYIQTNFDIAGGIGDITVHHANFGNDSGGSWVLKVSDDQGQTWTAFESDEIICSSTLEPVTISVNIDGNVRIRIEKIGGNRVNIDDIYITNYSSSAIVWTTNNDWSNVTGPTINDDVVIEGDLTTANFSANTLTVNGTIVIASGDTVTVQGAVVNHGDFTVEAGGNLIQVDDVENTGAITVKVEAQTEYFGFNMFSSPVAGQSFIDFSDNNGNEVFEYGYDDDETGDWEDASGNNFAEGYGYLFAAPYTGFPQHDLNTFYGEFVGVPHNGNVTVAADNEFVSLGNPYPSAIDADELLSANVNVGALYFWTNANLYDYDFDTEIGQGWGAANNYVTYSGLGGTTESGNGGTFTATNTIMTGQGFIVEASNGNVTFTNDMRINSGSGTFYKVMEEDKHRLWLNLEDSNNVKNQILIGYMEGASQGVDTKIDAKMFGYDGTALYSLIDNSDANYVIQGRYPFINTDVVPLGFRAVEGGTYTISLANFDGLFAEGQDIFLKDNLTDSYIDLKEEDYTFVSGQGVFDARFEVVYNATMSINNPTLDNNWVVYKQDGSFQIVSQGFDMSQVTVFDMLGRTIYQSEAINGTSHQLPQMGANGVLIIRITSADQGVSTKKVIN